jgi:hypothetical protein
MLSCPGENSLKINYETCSKLLHIKAFTMKVGWKFLKLSLLALEVSQLPTKWQPEDIPLSFDLHCIPLIHHH